MQLENLQKLFVHELRDLYNAENQILDALPDMIDRTSDDRLRSALQEHLEQTRGQVERLDRIFRDMGEDPKGQKCKGMEGLLREAKDLLAEDAAPAVRDAGIISSAQRVEHYEIAGYGTALTYAKLLDDTEATRLLQETLDEEKNADRELTEVAEGTVNIKAMD